MRSSEHGADGSSLTGLQVSETADSPRLRFPHSVSKFQQCDIASTEHAMYLFLVPLRLERYAAQHIVSAP